MRILIALVMLAALAATARAAPDAPTTITTTTTTAVAPPPAASPAPGEDVFAELDRVKDAYQDLAGASGAARKLAIFAGLSSLAYLLIAILKRSSWFLADAARKRWLPWVAGVLGVAAGLLASLGAGQPFVLALFYGAAPPASVFFHELLGQGKPA